MSQNQTPPNPRQAAIGLVALCAGLALPYILGHGILSLIGLGSHGAHGMLWIPHWAQWCLGAIILTVAIGAIKLAKPGLKWGYKTSSRLGAAIESSPVLRSESKTEPKN